MEALSGDLTPYKESWKKSEVLIIYRQKAPGPRLLLGGAQCDYLPFAEEESEL